MPDTAKCANRHCPSRNSCYRYRVKSSPFRQSWINPVYDTESGKCINFWPIDGQPLDLLDPPDAKEPSDA